MTSVTLRFMQLAGAKVIRKVHVTTSISLYSVQKQCSRYWPLQLHQKPVSNASLKYFYFNYGHLGSYIYWVPGLKNEKRGIYDIRGAIGANSSISLQICIIYTIEKFGHLHSDEIGLVPEFPSIAEPLEGDQTDGMKSPTL